MRSVSFYHKETGLLHAVTVVASDDEAIKLNTPADHEPIDNPADGSVHDHLSRRVDLETKTVVDYQPPQPSPDHEWNETTKRWQLNSATRERESKRRDAHARIAALADEERHLIRRLALNAFDGEAKERLAKIDSEIAELRLTAL